MKREVKRMVTGRGFLAGLALACAGIALGASYPQMGKNAGEALKSGTFIQLAADSLTSQVVSFFLPIAAVLPWSDSFLQEKRSGFLKAALPRIGRRDYVEGKIFSVWASGFLVWFLAGVLMVFAYFLLFFPFEERGTFPQKQFAELFPLLFRTGLLGSILSILGGICGAVGGSPYMAYGIPFVSYYFGILLYERYFQEQIWLYPVEWIQASAWWGSGGLGLYLFLLLFLLFLIGLFGGVLYGKLEEI